MSDGTKIEWAANADGTPGATWNPIRARTRDGKVGWFCVHASDGCRFCYAEAINRRLGTGVDYKAQNADQVEVFLDERTLTQPLRWRKPRTIFVGSMTDLFGEFVPDEMITQVFAVMALCPQHTFIVLSKRSARLRAIISEDGFAYRVGTNAAIMDPSPGIREFDPAWPLPNVWLGVSVEDQPNARRRIADLIATRAAVRFLSVEPMLASIDLYDANFTDGYGVDWVICGGESGRNARPMCVAWARSIRDQCAAAGVAFFFKQHGEFAPRKVNEPFDTVVRAADGAWGRLGEIHGADIYPMQRVGKKASGRLLDGVEHN